MDMSVRLLIIVSCLPSVLLLAFIYKKDRTEKEPFKLLLLLFVLGAVSCFPAAFFEGRLSPVYASWFGEESIAYGFFEYFFNVALFEELGKFLILYFVTRKNKNFNSLFDGMIYSVFVSLGFATLENIMYVSNYGLSVGLLRAVTAVPGHMFDAVFMGEFYTLWHLSKRISLTEKHYHQLGYIDTITAPEKRYKYYLPLTLIVPILAHGLYDFFATLQGTLPLVLFFTYLVFLYIFCFVKIFKLSKKDELEANLISAELQKKYPYLLARIQMAMQQNAMQYNAFTAANYTPYATQYATEQSYQSFAPAQAQAPVAAAVEAVPYQNNQS